MNQSTLTRSLLRLAFSLVIFTVLVPQPPAASAQDEAPELLFYESDLNQNGYPYEINRGPDGSLWVSDNGAGEIRRYAPNGSTVDIYSGLGAVSDARAAAGGIVWFADQDTQTLGRLDTLADPPVVTYWPLPVDTGNGLATALDGQGRVWISNFSEAMLYSFNPALAQPEMCTYDTKHINNSVSGTEYLAIEDGLLWMSDLYGNAILRFDLDTERLTRWRLASGWDFEAEGLTGDGAGGVWFADSSTGSLGRLDLTGPDGPVLLRSPLPPAAGQPVMVARSGGQVWYSGAAPSVSTPGAVGALDPAGLAPAEFTPDEDHPALSRPVCDSDLVPTPPAEVALESTIPEWRTVSYPVDVSAAGWAIIPLIEDPLPAWMPSPWGLTFDGNTLWAVDSGRAVILRAATGISITACSLADADGSLETEDDRSPIAGFAVSLLEDGVVQSPSPVTDASGCATWTDLAPGSLYGLQISPASAEWVALAPLDISLGATNIPAGDYRHEFLFASSGHSLFIPLVRR